MSTPRNPSDRQIVFARLNVLASHSVDLTAWCLIWKSMSDLPLEMVAFIDTAEVNQPVITGV